MDEVLAARAERLLDRLCADFPIGYRPTILWKRLRVSAGMAYYRDRTIGLSIPILDTEAKLDSTFKHEYAHLLAYARQGKKGAGHGPAWQQAMRDLGEEPVVHHRYEVNRNQPRQQVLYKCKRCGLLLTRKRRLPRRRKYVHAQCGGALTFHGVQAVETV